MFISSKISIIIVFYLIVITGLIIFSYETSFGSLINTSKEQKVIAANVVGLSAITLWGVANWDYFDTGMNKTSEGWFSENTQDGGADKLGHFYLSYATSHLYASVFEGWGYSLERGALLGSISSFAVMSWMEVGDSFSSYGFSHEDFLMNSFGCLMGYSMAVNPELSNKIDLRAEYIPDFKTADFFTDYNNMKYLVAIKLSGFNAVKNKIAKYFEFHFGYYSRNYPDAVNRKRNIYLGLGVNMSRIFNRYSMKKTAKLANYIQVPYTYASYSNDMN